MVIVFKLQFLKTRFSIVFKNSRLGVPEVMGRRLQNSTERSGVWGVKGRGYWDKNLGIERDIGQTFPNIIE